MTKSTEQRNAETDLRDAATAKGATVAERGPGHFQIRGRLLVNYYPFSKARTAYLDATTHGRKHVSPTEAVEMAFSVPPIVSAERKDDRGKNSKRKRQALGRRLGLFCHWCQAPLTLATSTLEHVIPLHRGGLDNPNNRVLACKPCNHERGHDMPELQANQGINDGR